MFKFFYSFVLGLSAVIYSPYFFYQMMVKGKYRKSFWQRLGFSFPKVQNPIWVHGVSVGEAKAIASLVKKIKQDFPRTPILFTTITETGLAEAKKACPEADFFAYLPFDFSIRSVVKKIKPRMVILCETDFWFNFMEAAKSEGAKIVLVNGKLSEKSMKRFSRASFISNKIFNLIDKIICQNSLYKERFERLDINPSKIEVGGNLKLDSDPGYLSEEELDFFKAELKLGTGPVLVVGSSHDPEEKYFLKAFKEVLKEYPSAQILLVPRHPERFDQVAKIIEEFSFSYGRLSQTILQKHPVILVDAMGKLKKCYQVATLAAVCGSWTEKVGGHNILEPSFYGKAVIYGPFLHTQPDFKVLMQEYEGGVESSSEDILKTLLYLLGDEKERGRLGLNGRRLVVESQGALQKTYDSIKNILSESLSI